MSIKGYIKLQAASGKRFVEICKHILDYLQTLEIKKKWAEMLYKLSDLGRTNYELALYHFKANNLSDAIFRFKVARWLRENYVETDYYIGLCHYDMFEYQKAKPYLSKYLTLEKAEHAEAAQFLLKVINSELDKLKFIPAVIITHKFEQIVTEYSATALINAPYEPQKRLFSMLAQHLQINDQSTANVLDLGCGVGTMGILARKAKIANLIHGVDITPAMAEISRNQNIDGIPIYNSVHNEDAISYMQKAAQSGERKFDVIFASDLLCYTTNTDELLLTALQLLSSKGTIGLTFRLSHDNKPYTFSPYIQQFTFSADYITQAASKYGFSIAAQQEVTLLNGDTGMCMVLSIA